MIGLLAAEEGLSGSAMRGAAWLVEKQNADGRWEDSEFTGTGFPNHLYLRYHMYAHYFPLMALGRLRQLIVPRHSQSRTKTLKAASLADGSFDWESYVRSWQRAWPKPCLRGDQA